MHFQQAQIPAHSHTHTPENVAYFRGQQKILPKGFFFQHIRCCIPLFCFLFRCLRFLNIWLMSAQRVGSSFQASSLCELSLSSARLRRHSALGETTAIMPSLMALLAKHAQLLVTQHESVLKASQVGTVTKLYIFLLRIYRFCAKSSLYICLPRLQCEYFKSPFNAQLTLCGHSRRLHRNWIVSKALAMPSHKYDGK